MDDPPNGVAYEILAYRKLSYAEAVATVRMFRDSRKRKLKRGKTYTIMTMIGANE